MAVAVALFGRSLSEAKWVSGNTAHVGGLWLGLLCGLLLAASRWRGWSALGYTAVLSLAAAAEVIGRVLPSVTVLQSASFADVVWIMHVRLLTLADRLNGWVGAYFGGEVIKDTGLFVFLLVITGWNASAWLAWCVLRRQRALEGLLPSGFLLALNVHLSGQPFSVFWYFVVSAGPLTAIAAFVRQHADWDRRQVDYSGELGFTWGASALTITLVIGLLAGVAPFVGTPQGWEMLSGWARVARLRTADTAAQLFSGVNPPAGPAARTTARTPDLEFIGEPPDQGNDTVMWVVVNDPAPPPPQADRPEARVPRHYWRSSIFATYTGKGWTPLQLSPFFGPPERLQTPAGRYELRQHFEIVAPHGEALFAVNLPVSAEGGAQLRSTALGDSARLLGTVSVYDVTSWATQLTKAQLNSAAAVYPPEISATYLQLPPSLPQRVRPLAARVTAGASAPYDKAARLQAYLRATYPYTLDVPGPPTDEDVVDYFLFEAPGGFCSYYASAMAVMLRSIGIPARVVTGYATGDYDYTRGAYRVPANASHAWVEVYFPDYGWVEFEPTAARAEFVYASESSPISAAAPEAPTPAQAKDRIPEWVIGAIGVLGIIGAAWWWLSQARQPGLRGPRGRAQALYRRIRWALASAGLAAAPSVTPGEFAAAAAPSLHAYKKLESALGESTDLYVQATFSPRAPDDVETRAAQRRWRQALPDWLKLWLRRHIA